MSKRTLSLGIIILGALVSILSLVADPIDFGFVVKNLPFSTIPLPIS